MAVASPVSICLPSESSPPATAAASPKLWCSLPSVRESRSLAAAAAPPILKWAGLSSQWSSKKKDESSEEERETLDGVGEFEHDESQRAEGESKEMDLEKKGKKKAKKRTTSFDDGCKRGVCYLSRIPPRMDPASLRHMLSQYGEIERIYLAPTDPAIAHVSRKWPGSCKGNAFSEGWVEFAKKSVAKRVANMLNGEQMEAEG